MIELRLNVFELGKMFKYYALDISSASSLSITPSILIWFTKIPDFQCWQKEEDSLTNGVKFKGSF